MNFNTEEALGIIQNGADLDQLSVGESFVKEIRSRFIGLISPEEIIQYAEEIGISRKTIKKLMVIFSKNEKEHLKGISENMVALIKQKLTDKFPDRNFAYSSLYQHGNMVPSIIAYPTGDYRILSILYDNSLIGTMAKAISCLHLPFHLKTGCISLIEVKREYAANSIHVALNSDKDDEYKGIIMEILNGIEEVDGVQLKVTERSFDTFYTNGDV